MSKEIMCSIGLLAAVFVNLVSAKPPDGYRTIPDGYENGPLIPINNNAHHGAHQHNSQQKDSRTPVPLHDFNRVRGVYIDGKPVVAGVTKAVPLNPVRHNAQNQLPQQAGHGKAPYGGQPPAPEYYDEVPYSGPQSAYIPTAPYPSSIYGRPPFWVRLQRWNPFSRFYRTTYTIGAPEYIPQYGYVVPPVMVLPAPPNSKIEPVFNPTPAQRRFSLFSS